MIELGHRVSEPPNFPRLTRAQVVVATLVGTSLNCANQIPSVSLTLANKCQRSAIGTQRWMDSAHGHRTDLAWDQRW